uniref:Quattro n=1 Tax=Mastacembelus armatus TaxID=205130 RepID=A0A3Q3MTL9_9TELE
MCTDPLIESLDSSIQSALSALFLPFEATAPIVLSQLFRTIEERYHGDALQCLLDFLIPSKHLLESVQQAACACYSDVVFRCEGWPLCLHDKTVIQLAPVNPLLLRPGDFYLQVEPFGDQAARIVLKSLLEEGCREVEETPVPETSYSCIFTEEWLQDINEGRHGAPLSCCLLCTDQGVIKLPWAKIAIPEFLDKPKIMPTYQEAPPEPKQISVASHFNSSTLPMEAMTYHAKDRISASLRPVNCSSKLVKTEHERRIPKSCCKPLIKPVGWVSPNMWGSGNYQEIEGDYVDLVDITKGKEFVDKQRDNHPNPSNSALFKPVRPPPPVPLGNNALCGHTFQYADDPCTPCNQRQLGQELTDQDMKCRYRDSYLAALRNPVTLERESTDLLTALEEVGLCEEGGLRPKGKSEAQRNAPGNICNHCKETICHEICQYKPSPDLRDSQKVQTKFIPQQLGHNARGHPESDVFLENHESDMKPHEKAEVVKPSGKHKVKMRSLSTVSETPTGSPLLYKVNNRSHSDICPEMITSLIQELPKPEGLAGKSPKKGKQSKQLTRLNSVIIFASSYKIRSILLTFCLPCLSPGSRDRTGRAVVEVHGDRKEWMSPLVSAQNICELLLYLHSMPRKEVQELGMTMVINARKKPPPFHLYKALLMAQEQALHAVHSVVMLIDKDTCPRPEKQPGIQMDMVTSIKALNKTVEASQLTSDMGGTFPYSHIDWLQFHQRLVSFLTDLRGADSLLQKAIKKVNGSRNIDTAQDVQLCIQEQKASMKEVLEDTRLVTLQREGGAVLARMRREEFRFPQSEDYRDALELVTSLYNQVEEKLHMLVMRSNESLQQMEFLFRLREMETKIKAEQRLKDSFTTDDTLVWVKEIVLLACHQLLQEKQQYAMTLVTEAEGIVGTSDSSPATDIFRTLVSTFKSKMDDFMLRAEQRYKELSTLVQMYHFCDQASALGKECSHFLGEVEQGCYSGQTVSTLQMYEERLDMEFSTLHFQALKAKARTVGSSTTGTMKMWNAARIQCQEVRQRLREIQKKKGIKRNQIQQATSPSLQGEDGVMEKNKRSEVGENEKSLTQKPASPKDVVSTSESATESTATCINHHAKPDLTGCKKGEYSVQKLPEHHSEVDLRITDCNEVADDFPLHKALGRSQSEGSCMRSHLTITSDFPPLSVRHKHCERQTQPLDQNLPIFHNNSLQSDKLSCKSERDSNKEEGEGCCKVSTQIMLHFHFSFPMWNRRLRMIMDEVLSTEREYVKALGYVREHYFPELERPDVPQDLRGQKGSIFGNLEKLHDFHRHHFLNELESCANEPFRVGRCFLRHRESFALYALYSKNKPQSDSLLINHGQAFFKQKQLKLGDKMDLWSYLLKPVQRISKYSLLLHDMMRECGPEQTREMAEVKAALEVIHFQLRHGNNLLAMDAIQHCDVNLKEQGQLIRQDEFLVTFRKKKCFRHIFLFQELILFSKTKKTDVGNDTYIYKQSFKTSDIGMTQNSGDSGLCFEIWFRKRKTQDTYTLQAVSHQVKQAWTKDLERILWEQAVHNREIRMQERVFLGIGNKPFMDIQPSDAAISDRSVNYILMGRGKQIPPVTGLFILLVAPVDSSESSGESVSGFSSSSHNYNSAAGGEVEDTTSVCASIITIKEATGAHGAEASASFDKLNDLAVSPEKTQPPVAPKPKLQYQATDLPCDKVQYKSHTQ